MRTNIVLDEDLVNEALKLSKAKTKKELIHMALKQYVDNHKRKNLMELKGKISFAENYNYKEMRKADK